ncbi:MAG: hypothetical protein ACLFQB_13360 [Chitinispirillaceae bacterium]
MGKIIEFLKKHGFTLMLIGLFIAIASVIVMISIRTPRYAGTIYPQLATGGAIAGFVIYFIGRIGVLIQRRDSSKQKDRS